MKSLIDNRYKNKMLKSINHQRHQRRAGMEMKLTLKLEKNAVGSVSGLESGILRLWAIMLIRPMAIKWRLTGEE